MTTNTNDNTTPEVGTADWFTQQGERFTLQVGMTQIAENGGMSEQARDGFATAAQDEIDRLNDAVIAAPAPTLEAVKLKARMLVQNYEYTPALTVESAYRLEMIEPEMRMAASIWADLERMTAADASKRQPDAPCTREIASAALHAIDGVVDLDGICATFHALVEAGDLEQEALAWMAGQLSVITGDLKRRVQAVHNLTRDPEAAARLDALLDTGRRAAA